MSLWRRELIERLASLGLKPEHEAEIVEELAQHLDDRVEDLVAEGVEPGSRPSRSPRGPRLTGRARAAPRRDRAAPAEPTAAGRAGARTMGAGVLAGCPPFGPFAPPISRRSRQP